MNENILIDAKTAAVSQFESFKHKQSCFCNDTYFEGRIKSKGDSSSEEESSSYNSQRLDATVTIDELEIV